MDEMKEIETIWININKCENSIDLGSKSRRRWAFRFRIPAGNGTSDRLSHDKKTPYALSVPLFEISVLMATTGRTQRYTHDARTNNPKAKNAHPPIWLCEATEKCFWIRRLLLALACQFCFAPMHQPHSAVHYWFHAISSYFMWLHCCLHWFLAHQPTP